MMEGFRDFYHIREARAMLKDPGKPILTQNVAGWRVYFYDKEREEYADETGKLAGSVGQIADALENLKGRLQSGYSVADLAAMSYENQRGMEAKANAIIQDKGDQGVGTLDPDENREIAKFVYDGMQDTAWNYTNLNFKIFRLLGIEQWVARYVMNLDDTVDEACLKGFHWVLENLPRFLSDAVQDQNNPTDRFRRKGAAGPEAVIQGIMPVIQSTLAAVQAAGVRNAHKVPVRVVIGPERPQIGTSQDRAAGMQHAGHRFTTGKKPTASWENNKQSTQYVDLYVVPGEDYQHLAGVLVHEIGHVLYATSPDLQKAAEGLAYSMPAPSEYGKTSYRYTGAGEDSFHHKTGNEWFAEMFTAVVLGINPGFTPQQIAGFRRVLAGAGNAPHPHAGMSYRLGQAQPGYRFPDTHQAVVDPNRREMGLPSMPDTRQ